MSDSLFEQFLSEPASIPPPGVSEAFKNFSGWGEKKLEELANNGSMGKFVTQLLQSGESGENIGNALRYYLADSVDRPTLQASLQQFLKELLNQNSSMGDDLVRNMVGNGANLDALSPGILIEMKLILQNGDDAALNGPALDSVNTAYQAAKSA
jgi:hypothetical protein